MGRPVIIDPGPGGGGGGTPPGVPPLGGGFIVAGIEVLPGADVAMDLYPEQRRVVIRSVSGGMPTGAIIPWGAAAAPAGFLLCDGAAVSRTDYAALFAVIGTTYGVGDGSTTFNLPNLKGRVPVGLDAAQTEFDALAETGGAKTHTLTTAEMPAHTHVQAVRDTILGGETRAERILTGSGQIASQDITASTGGGGAHNNLAPYIVLHFVVKT